VAVASNSYNAGDAAGATNVVEYTMGANYGALPAGCVNPTVNGQAYYLCGNTWFSPAFGANGVYYRVVPTP
jgi:hypothetical protein